jgi:hypothetical protein
MANVDIELDDKMIKGIISLAVYHYGDSGDPSVDRVVESALEMRLLSIKLAERGRDEIEDPMTIWEFDSKQPAEQLPTEIRNWLFKRR